MVASTLAVNVLVAEVTYLKMAAGWDFIVLGHRTSPEAKKRTRS